MKQYTVIGLGRFGSSVAKSLIKLGHEVVVVDTNEDNITALDVNPTHALIGDSTHADILKAAGVKEVDVVIIAMTDFETSVLTSLLCKELGAKKIISKARDAVHRNVLIKIGVDEAIIPEWDAGLRLAHNLSSRNIIDMIQLSSDYEIVEVSIPENWIGKTVAQLDIRKKYSVNILGINRGKENFIGNITPDTSIKPGDSLVILGKLEEINKIQLMK